MLIFREYIYHNDRPIQKAHTVFEFSFRVCRRNISQLLECRKKFNSTSKENLLNVSPLHSRWNLKINNNKTSWGWVRPSSATWISHFRFIWFCYKLQDRSWTWFCLSLLVKHHQNENQVKPFRGLLPMKQSCVQHRNFVIGKMFGW